MKKILLILLLLLFVPFCAQAAETNRYHLRMSAAYYGELILHPGMTVGADFSFLQFKRFDVHLNVEVGGYHHKWYQNTYFSNYSLGFRFGSQKSFFIDPQLNFAFFLTEPDGDIYTTVYNDEYPHYPVEPNLKFGLAFLLGWRLNDLPVEIFFGPDIYLESKINYMLVPHFALKLGAAICLGGEK